MGFTTGLLSGLTLTTSTLYLTLLLHRRNRFQQSHELAYSTASLTSIYDPPPLRQIPRGRYQNGGLVQMAKDRWNKELTENVRRVAYTDWANVGRDVVGTVEVTLARGIGAVMGKQLARDLKRKEEEKET